MGQKMNKAFHYALKAFLVLSAVFYFPIKGPVTAEEATGLAYLYQELFVRYGFLVLIALSNFLPRKREMKEPVVWIALILLGLASLLTGFDVNVRRALLNVFIALFFYKTIVEHFDFDELKSLGYWFLGILLLNGFWMTLQYFGHDHLFRRVDDFNVHILEKLVGFMKLKVNIGVLAALLSPALAFVSPWLLLVPLPFIYVSQSSAAALAWLISTLFILYFRCGKRNFFTIVIFLSIVAFSYIVFFDMPDGQFGERFKVWAKALFEVLKTNPVFGMGLGAFSKWAPETLQGNNTAIGWHWAHNEYLQWFFETGFLGTVPLILFLRSKLDSFLRFSKDGALQILFACFISIAIISFIQFPFHVGKFSGICVFLIALYQAKIEELNWRL